MHPTVLVPEIVEIASLSDDEQMECAASLSDALFFLQTMTGADIRNIVVADAHGGERVDRARLDVLVAELLTRTWSELPHGRRTFFGRVVDSPRAGS